MPVKYRRFGFTLPGADRNMDEACWNPPKTKPDPRGRNVILISSYSFQAPAFYQERGYELAWRLDDFPPGYQHFFLVKRLSETGPSVL
jgi:hypothetical protein